MRLKRIYLAQKRTFDLPLLGIVSILVCLGLVLVYDVSIVQASRDFGDSLYYIRQQIIWVALGLIAVLFFANFDYHKLRKLAWLGVVISLCLLLAVFIPRFGTEVGGAHRWLNLGFVTIQPAELFKLASVIWLAAIFEKGIKLKHLLILLLVGLVILAVFQRDLGSALVFVGMSSAIYLAAGGSIFKMLLGIPLGLLALVVLVISSEYRKRRILAFLDPFSDPQGFTYHISQVLVALGSGGLLGLGLGQSRQKFYIPEVTTDSIFAVVGEELGFLGALFTVGLFGALIIRGMRIAERAADNFGKLLALGIISWLGIQTVINLGSLVALFPLTGVPLPFISYGGSALVVNLAAVGILLNISKKSYE